LLHLQFLNYFLIQSPRCKHCCQLKKKFKIKNFKLVTTVTWNRPEQIFETVFPSTLSFVGFLELTVPSCPNKFEPKE
jgi:hypothetical protein